MLNTTQIKAVEVEIEGDETTKAVKGKPVKRIKIKSVLEPLDKASNTFFNKKNQEKARQENGSYMYALQTGTGKGGQIGEVFALLTDVSEAGEEIGMTRPLTNFDKRVHDVVASLYDVGYQEITVNQIYTVMNGDVKSNKDQRKRINDSLTKMAMTRVYIDNEREIGVLEGYKPFRHDDYLLSFQRDSYVGGNNKITMNNEPILIRFAKQRKQITKIPQKVLCSPLGNSEGNLALQEYLNLRIVKAKKGKLSNRILFNTIFDHCGISEKKQRQRTKKAIKELFDYYVKIGFLNDFKLENDGISIL